MTVQTQSSEQSLPKVDLKEVTVQKFIAELWTVILNKMIKYHLPHTCVGQASGDKQNIYLYEKLSTNKYWASLVF